MGWEAGAAFDVIVAGAGNAALCAALAAREEGAGVLVLEKAPYEERGGNSAFSGALFRFAHDGLEDVVALVPDLTPEEISRIEMGPFTRDAYFEEWMRLSDGRADPDLVRVVVDQSYDTLRWMQDQGVRFELYQRAPRKGGRICFQPGNELQAWGGGGGLVQQLFHIAEGRGVSIAYSTAVVGLLTDNDGRVSGVRIRGKDGIHTLESRAVVLASGGFESSPEMRARYLGPGWDAVKVRGTRFNTGETLEAARLVGAATTGHWSGSDTVPIDIDAPLVGTINLANLTVRSSYRLGIMVNLRGQRFVDEGQDFHATIGGRIGQLINQQPGGVAYQIFDQQTVGMLEERYQSGSRPVTSDTIEGLAKGLGINAQALAETVRQFNQAVQDGEFDHTIRDGKGTNGLNPPKSNWALRLERPPYVAYGVVGGIMFTYGGLAVDTEARVLDVVGQPIPGLYAAGEITGGFYHENFATGSGLMRGSVFGRIAGRNAARGA